MRKKLVAPLIIGGTLLGSLATAGVASAATPGVSHGQVTKGQLKAWVRSHRQELRKDGLAVSAKAIGVASQELATDLKAGNSIAGVASQHNVAAESVVNALVNAADGKINEAVTAGKLNATLARHIEAALPERLTRVVNHTF